MTTYHVSIEFNNSGKRDVGTVIYLLERRKFVFKNREDKVLEPDGLRTYTIELEGHCRKPAFLDHLKCRYSKQKLEKKLQHFIHNHVDLTFESSRENVGLEELRAYITIGAFPQKNPPIVCVYKEDVGGIEHSNFLRELSTEYLDIQLFFFASFLQNGNYLNIIK